MNFVTTIYVFSYVHQNFYQVQTNLRCKYMYILKIKIYIEIEVDLYKLHNN